MKIAVIAAFDLSQKKAWALNSVKMAHGFSQNNHEVHLICRKCKNNETNQTRFLENFGVDKNIHIHALPYCFGENMLFGLASALIVFKHRVQAVYARNYIAPLFTATFGIPTAVESHAHPGNRSPFYKMHLWGMRHLKNIKVWITISPFLKKHYNEDLNIPKDKIHVLPDAVDETLFTQPRILPRSPYATKDNIVYTGHMYDYKGIPTILNVAKNMPNHHFHFIGGFPEDIERHKEFCTKNKIKNCKFYGYKPHKDLPNYLWHADALLLPPSMNHPSAKWTSPMKLGEYLAAGVPVICSNIPALKEWVTDKDVLFFKADNPQSLEKSIITVLKENQEKRIQNGINLAKKMTYKNRSLNVLTLIKD